MGPVGILRGGVRRRPPLTALRERLQWHPEAWPLAVSAGAWVLLIAQSRAPFPALAFCGKPTTAAATSLDLAAPAALAGWLMIAAMMLPLIVPPIRYAAFASLWRRRHRAVAGFVIGYSAPWLAAATLPFAITAALSLDLSSSARAAGMALAMAALWQLTGLKRRALSLCHRTIPLRPDGWRADWDCLRFGVIHARACIASCWAMMLAAGLAMDHLAVMAAVTAVAATERYRPRRNQRVEALLLAVPALACAVGAAL